MTARQINHDQFWNEIERLLIESPWPGFLILEDYEIAKRLHIAERCVRSNLEELRVTGRLRKGGTHGEWWYYSPEIIARVVSRGLQCKGLFVRAAAVMR